MLGLSSTICWVSWFVYFYIWAMIIMPFAGRAIDKKPVVYTPILMAAAYAALFAVHRFILPSNTNDWTQALFDCLLETPLMLLGYAFARTSLYHKINVPAKWSTIIIAVVGGVLILVAKAHIRSSIDIFINLVYVPTMILCILAIFTAKPMKILSKVMMELGDKSVYMWFFHALFFTAATRPVYQHFVMVSDNLWIIALWTIILSYICSYIIKKVADI